MEKCSFRGCGQRPSERRRQAEAVRQTAARYQHGIFVEIPESDHMVFSGAALPVTLGHIVNWMLKTACSPLASSSATYLAPG